MRTITSNELLKLEDGALFCETDLPATPVYQKLSNSGLDDVLVRPLQEDEHMRLGLRGMSVDERNSKRYGVLSLSDLPQSWSLPDENKRSAEIEAEKVN